MTVTTTHASAAAAIRAMRPGVFVRVDSLPGAPSARRQAVSRAVDLGELLHVRHGLYYRGTKTRYGMSAPSALEVAFQALGRKGVGPAGYSAAREWSLTTQVPATIHLAALKPAKDLPGVTLTVRSNLERLELAPKEIALIELLRDPDVYVEAGWEALVDAVASAAAGEGSARAVRIGKALHVASLERDVATRANAARLDAQLRSRLSAAA